MNSVCTSIWFCMWISPLSWKWQFSFNWECFKFDLSYKIYSSSSLHVDLIMEVVAKQLHALPSLWPNKEKQASCFKWMSSKKVLGPYFTISNWKADWTGIYHIFAEAHTCTQTQNYTHAYSTSAGGWIYKRSCIHTLLGLLSPFCADWFVRFLPCKIPFLSIG